MKNKQKKSNFLIFLLSLCFLLFFNIKNVNAISISNLTVNIPTLNLTTDSNAQTLKNSDESFSDLFSKNTMKLAATSQHAQQTGSFSFSKLDATTFGPVAGAVFQLINPQTHQIVATATSTSDGVVHFSNIPNGNYVLYENQPPLNYGPANPEPVNITNGVATIDGAPADAEHCFVLDEPLADLTFKKVDAATSKPLSGATFTLSENGKVIATATSNAEGKVTIPNLYDGQYTLKETKAPSGYQLSTTTYNITVEGGKVTNGVPNNMITDTKIVSSSSSSSSKSSSNLSSSRLSSSSAILSSSKSLSPILSSSSSKNSSSKSSAHLSSSSAILSSSKSLSTILSSSSSKNSSSKSSAHLSSSSKNSTSSNSQSKIPEVNSSSLTSSSQKSSNSNPTSNYESSNNKVSESINGSHQESSPTINSSSKSSSKSTGNLGSSINSQNIVPVIHHSNKSTSSSMQNESTSNNNHSNIIRSKTANKNSSHKEILPQTGEKETAVIGLGIIIILASGVLIYESKH